MVLARIAAVTWLLLSGILCSGAARAQDLVLTTDCEDGFRQLIRMAQTGWFGEEVTNANVGVEKDRVRVELVRPGAPSTILLLAPKSPMGASSGSGYFDVSPGPGATAADVARVGKALAEIFPADPFVVAGLELSPGSAPPGLVEAWANDSWRGVARALERRLMVLAGLPYTIGVIAGIGLAVLAVLVLLWTSIPPPRPGCADG